MDNKEMLDKIVKEIEEAAPPFRTEHVIGALNNTNVYLFRYFPKLKMIVLTERICREFHCRPVYHDMPESFSNEFVSEEYREQFEQMYFDINEGKPSTSVEFRGKGGNVWCHVTLTTMEWDDEHRPEMCTGVMENRTKEELSRQEQDNILASISCGVLQYRQSDNKLILANEAALKILGYQSIEEIVEDGFDGIVGTVIQEDHEYMEKVVSGIREPGEVRTVEYRVKHKGSEDIRYCYGTVQVFDNIHGERIVQRSIMDITDRKQKEDMQHANNELVQRMNTIMNGISGGLEITRDDPKFTYVYLSEGIAALQGYSVEEFLKACNGNVLDNIYPEDREHVIESIRDITPDSPTYVIKYRRLHKDGSIRWISDTGKKIIDKNGDTLCYCLIQDITDQQERLEEISHLLTMQRQMITSLSSGVFAYTYPEHKVLVINKEAKRIFRYTPDNTKPFIETIFDHILPEDRLEVREAVKNLKQTGDSCEYKLHPLTDDGKRLTVECVSKLRAFDDGRQFILSVLQDITKMEERTNELNEMNEQQEKMIIEIRQERQQYRDALVSGSEYVYRFDVTDGMVYSDFDYSTRGSVEENLGIAVPVAFDEMIRHWRKLMKPLLLTPKEQNPMTTEEVRDCFDRGMKHIVTEYYNETEKKYYRRTFLLSMDEATGHILAIAIVNDITNIMREETRKNNELAMINRDLRKQIGISQAFSSIYFASWEINLETWRMTEISVPDWAEDIFRQSKGDSKIALEMMVQSFVLEESKANMMRFLCTDDMAQRLKGESILTCEYQGQHYGWCAACLIPCMENSQGDVIRALFALRGIEHEKRVELETKQALEEAYEAANRANAAKTEFLSSISHDIRTPMNGIIGMTAIAGTHIDDAERVADCLSKIAISSKHLLGLINEVLDMNKIESGKLDLNVEEFNLSELVDSLLVMSKMQLQNKKQELSVSVHDVSHENVIGDSLRIQQVFMNLLSNAIKYTPEGGKIRLLLTEKQTNRPRIGCYEFIVEDNGIGMDRDYLEHLFEPFSRAKDQRVEKIQGTGLGMPIARNIVRMMNGDIKVESELSKGTKFTVTIYLELQEEDAELRIEEFTDLPILVADDDEMACESTCNILEELGMKGEWVLSGEEAVEKTVARHEEKDDYFAVILDWKMPGMDGLETAKKIREQVGEQVPIIILSAYDWSDIEQRARKAGVRAFISKPLFKSRVSHLFKSLLGKESEQQPGFTETEQLAEADFKGKRVLLAEDNELNAEIACEIFSMFHLEVEHAQNGKEAFEMVEASPDKYYDIIFMDIQMPIMNGYEAVRAIRALSREDIERIPIIAMTANAFAEDVQAAKNAGMNEHLAKPLNIAQLIKILKRWLD